MNDNILHAIESLCDDIATSTNAEDNQKRANAILALAFGGIFTPEEIEEARDWRHAGRAFRCNAKPTSSASIRAMPPPSTPASDVPSRPSGWFKLFAPGAPAGNAPGPSSWRKP